MPTEVRRARPALGTFIEIRLENEPWEGFANWLFEEAVLLERTLSNFDSKSELSKVNRRRRSLVSDELAVVLGFGVQIEHNFDRRFRLMPECRHSNPCYRVSGNQVLRETACRFDLG